MTAGKPTSRFAPQVMTILLDAIVVVLLVVSVAFIYSTGHVGSEWSARSLWHKQVLWAVLGIAAYYLCAYWRLETVQRLAPLGYGVSIVLLVLVLVAGIERYGAQRWLSFFSFTFQPAEPAKLLTICFLAAWLAREPSSLTWRRQFCLACLIAIIPIFLILVEPSLGAALTLVPPLCAMIVVSLFPARWLLLSTAFLLVAGVLVSALLFSPGLLGLEDRAWADMFKTVGMHDYQIQRVESFLNGEGWNELQSRIAVSTGGLTGKGFLEGTQKTLGYLPRTVAPTDFIFTVIAEETGFAGTCAILVLYAGLTALGFETAARAPTAFGRLAALGITVLLSTHAFVNISMTISLLPVTGLPLPLLSYGGSFLLCSLAGLGLIRNICLHSTPAQATPPQECRSSARSDNSKKRIQMEFKL